MKTPISLSCSLSDFTDIIIIAAFCFNLNSFKVGAWSLVLNSKVYIGQEVLVSHFPFKTIHLLFQQQFPLIMHPFYLPLSDFCPIILDPEAHCWYSNCSMYFTARGPLLAHQPVAGMWNSTYFSHYFSEATHIRECQGQDRRKKWTYNWTVPFAHAIHP